MKKLDASGVVIEDGANTPTKGYMFTWTSHWYRHDRQLPFLVKGKLGTFAKSEVKRVTKGTDGLNGTFAMTVNGEEVAMKFDEHPDHLKANISKLTSINRDDIIVKRSGNCHWGCTWTIEFHGLHTKPVIAQGSLTSLTHDPEVTLTFEVVE